MKTSAEWFGYFRANLQKQRIDWSQQPDLDAAELETILASVQAWQLGETSDGNDLIRSSQRFAKRIEDDHYVKAIELFIKEEQKHGNNLGKYLDMIGKPRIKQNWGDTLFRLARHFNKSMEWWTLTVITVESSAQIFYQCLKDATGCPLLKQVCTDILIDEAAHINFQMERMTMIFERKNKYLRGLFLAGYTVFYYATSWVVWLAHRKVFDAGGKGLKKYMKTMRHKFNKTLGQLNHRGINAPAVQMR